MANESITRRLKIYVNGQEVDATITNLRKNLAKFRTQSNRAVEGTPEWKKYNAEVAKTEIELKQAYAAQKDFRDSAKLTEKGLKESSKTLADFTGSLSQLFQGAKRGDFLQMQEGFDGVKKGILGATKAGLAFIATPIGATIAVLAGIAAVSKLWYNYNKTIAESVKLTQQLTGFDGKELEQYRASVQATANTFDKEFNEVLRSANSLSKQMKISQQEALDLINQGFVRGADLNGEFLDKLKEYPVQFKNAGFSAQDFIDIATQEVKGGVYNDKLVDALKEADLALKEMTKTQRDALENAFGKKFTDEIAQGIQSGEITTKEAIGRIIDEAENLGLNFQQQQQLVADVFKGAGEDAGGFAEIVLQLNESFKEENKTLNENEQATQRLVDANKEYEQALADLFDSSKSGFPSMLTNIKAVSAEIFTNTLRGFKLMFTSLDQLKESAASDGQKEAFEAVSEYAKATGRSVKEEADFLIQSSKENIHRLRGEIADVGIAGSLFGTKSALETKLAENEAYLKELQLIAKGESQEFINFQKKLEEEQLKKTKTNSTLTDDEEKKKQKAVDDAIRKKQAVQDAIDKFDEEQAIRDQLKQVEKDQRAEEEDVIRKQLEFEKLITEAQGDTELLAQIETAKLNEIQAIRDSYAEKRLQKEEEEKKKLADLDKKVKAERLQAEQNFQQAKSNALNAGLNTLQSVFGKETALGKALFLFQKGKAISEIIQSTALANAKIGSSLAAANALAIAASPLTGGQPWVTRNTASSAKNTAANNINAASQIAIVGATALKGIASREVGGFTPNGPSTGGLDGRGGQLVMNHPNEYYIPQPLIRQDPEVPRIIEYLEAKRTGKTTNDAPETSETNNQNSEVMMMLAQAVNNLVEKGVQANTFYGLDDERERQKIQEKLDKTILESKN